MASQIGGKYFHIYIYLQSLTSYPRIYYKCIIDLIIKNGGIQVYDG